MSNTELDRWLLEKGKATVDEADVDGCTPLRTAAAQGDMVLVRWLIEIGGASINKACDGG
jgi:ankyrin repeat protein